ncbi:fibroblast growth factor 19 [Callorhinchus milii]|uniref:fibroblast growth factor 19 n=1 Tax=Callorhinchus milii TaxID=7868 RepID=UPI001C3F7DA9|nr:fibroblast growth factor 19 [Callorhinchus milii]
MSFHFKSGGGGCAMPCSVAERGRSREPGMGVRCANWLCLILGCAFLARSLCRPPPAVTRDSGAPLELGWGHQIRLKHLYTEGDSKHLQINPDGRVNGSNAQNVYTLLEIRAVEPGHVVIKGVRTGRYLCMNAQGNIFGSTTYREDDCNFKEELLQTFYNAYHSLTHLKVLSLSLDKRPFVPNRELPPLSMFLPRENHLPITSSYIRRAPDREDDSTDPFGMRSVQRESPKISRSRG